MRGRPGGRGGSGRRRRAPLGLRERESQGKGGRAASEGEGTGSSGVSVALVEGPGLPGGSRRWPRQHRRSPRLASVLLAKEEDDRGESGGGLGRAGPVGGAR